MSRPRERTRTAGFTLIEAAIVIVVMTIVFGALFSALVRSQVFSAEFTRQGVVEETGWRISNRLSEDLFLLAPDTLLPATIDGTIFIEYQEVVDYDTTTGEPILGDYVLIGWNAGPGESLNGLDDNQDGRIDEGFISRIDKGNKTPYGAYPGPGQWKSSGNRVCTQLAGNVVGLTFDAVTFPNCLSYTVTIALVNDDGTLTQDTFTTLIRFRQD